MNDEATKERRQFTAEQKVKIVKEALTTDIGVSGVCRKYGISNALYYHWQERFLEGALEGFKRTKHSPSSAEQRKIDSLERDNDRMKSVIAEITAENIDLKKALGNCERGARCGRGAREDPSGSYPPRAAHRYPGATPVFVVEYLALDVLRVGLADSYPLRTLQPGYGTS